MRSLLIGLAAWLIAAPCLAQTGPEINLLAFSNGALVDRVTSTQGYGWEPIWLLDESPNTGFASKEHTRLPIEIVISLAERSELRRLAFNTEKAQSAEVAAKNIEVLMSDQSSSAGFVPVMSLTLAGRKDGQSFTLPKPATGKWLKLVVKSNYGDPDQVEIMDVLGFGVQLTKSGLPNVAGTYSSGVGKFHIKQDGAQLTGCYENNDGVIQGDVEASLMRLRWSEVTDQGVAVMVLNRDGKGFTSLWRKDDEKEWHDDWNLQAFSKDVGTCGHWKPQTTNVVAAALAKEGRVRLYGINFDTDSDKLRPDSKPVLDQLLAALKVNSAWKVTVEGHTDSTGTPEKNKDLSNRRAASVKAFLVSAGIAADRIATAGFGQDQPVAPNDTTLGRAQNRRVEVAR